MKDLSTKILALATVAFFAFGCSFIENVQRQVQDTASNTNAGANTAREALGLKKSGIAECDELVDVLAARSKNQANTEDSWFNKAAEELIKQQIYDQLSQNEPHAAAESGPGAQLQNRARLHARHAAAVARGDARYVIRNT
jgi:hypothetical protein